MRGLHLFDDAMETIASERTVLEAAQTMAEMRIGSLLVIEAGEMVGIVTDVVSDRGPSPCEQHQRRGCDELSPDSD